MENRGILIFTGRTDLEPMVAHLLGIANFKSDKGYRNLGDFVQKEDHYFWKWNNWDIIKEELLLHVKWEDFISFTWYITSVTYAAID